MKRLLTMVVLGLPALAFLTWALLVPAHFKAIDAAVLQKLDGASVVDAGLEYLKEGKVGPARMFSRFAREQSLDGASRLELSLSQVTDPSLLAWGGAATDLDRLFAQETNFASVPSRPIMNWLLGSEARARTLEYLQVSQRFGVRDILKTRGLTNLAHFSAVGTAAGQPMDAVTLLSGLLLQGDNLSSHLKTALETKAFAAVREGKVQELELVYLDLIALGTRLDWSQLTELLKQIDSLESLQNLAALVRKQNEQLPTLYTGILLAPSAGGVLDYLLRYSRTGFRDLQFSLGAGTEAFRKLIGGQRQVAYPRWRDRLTQYEPFYSAYSPVLSLTARAGWLGLVVKYGLMAACGFLLAQMVIALLPFWSAGTTRRLFGPGNLLMAGSFVVVLLILSEPFLMQAGQDLEVPLRWKFPVVEGNVGTKTLEKRDHMAMDSFTTASLLTFFVIQCFLYAACLAKIAQIRRQPLSSPMKLKLLENEEHLFDSGLYCGFGGTVTSFLLLAMGIVKPSLMAAYSSTLFGIIFVAILKIFHLRPFRKTLILNGEVSPR